MKLDPLGPHHHRYKKLLERKPEVFIIFIEPWLRQLLFEAAQRVELRQNYRHVSIHELVAMLAISAIAEVRNTPGQATKRDRFSRMIKSGKNWYKLTKKLSTRYEQRNPDDQSSYYFINFSPDEAKLFDHLYGSLRLTEGIDRIATLLTMSFIGRYYRGGKFWDSVESQLVCGVTALACNNHYR